MKDKIFFLYATKFSKCQLRKAPEILYAVYVISSICKLIFAMFYSVMSLCSFCLQLQDETKQKNHQGTVGFETFL